jgi:hypothetical protein
MDIYDELRGRGFTPTMEIRIIKDPLLGVVSHIEQKWVRYARDQTDFEWHKVPIKKGR